MTLRTRVMVRIVDGVSGIGLRVLGRAARCIGLRRRIRLWCVSGSVARRPVDRSGSGIPPRRAGIFPVLGVFPVIGVSRQHERLFRRASHDARPGTGRPSRRTCRHRQQQRGENEHELDRDHEAGGRLLGGGERGTRRRIGLEPVEHTAVGGTGLNESRPLIERCHSRRAQGAGTIGLFTGDLSDEDVGDPGLPQFIGGVEIPRREQVDRQRREVGTAQLRRCRQDRRLGAQRLASAPRDLGREPSVVLGVRTSVPI